MRRKQDEQVYADIIESIDCGLDKEKKQSKLKKLFLDNAKIVRSKKIGEGAFGNVYLADYNGKQICVKVKRS